MRFALALLGSQDWRVGQVSRTSALENLEGLVFDLMQVRRRQYILKNGKNLLLSLRPLDLHKHELLFYCQTNVLVRIAYQLGRIDPSKETQETKLFCCG